MVVAFFLQLAEDLRRSLAAVGARSVGESSAGPALPARGAREHDRPVALLSPAWDALADRRATPWAASRGIKRQAASALESRLVAALDGQEGGLSASGLRVTTAERSFGAALTGAIHRGELRAPVRLALRGAAGQSFGAWAGDGVSLVLEGTANDYVGKGLSGGHLVVRPAPEMLAGAAATPTSTPGLVVRARRQHLPVRRDRRPAARGRPGRHAVRDPHSGAEAVVEGVGPHGCEYMTGGAVVVLGPVGQSFGAGMTGGRAYLWDPSGRHVAALHGPSVRASGSPRPPRRARTVTCWSPSCSASSAPTATRDRRSPPACSRSATRSWRRVARRAGPRRARRRGRRGAETAATTGVAAAAAARDAQPNRNRAVA
jgi:hypothetical protein